MAVYRDPIDLHPRVNDPVVDRRDNAADGRDNSAKLRDTTAGVRDDVAAVRDRIADHRDHLAERAEATQAAGVLSHVLSPIALSRQQARADRRQSAQDRHASASGRTQAGDDRQAASGDRVASAEERHSAATDVITGVYGRVMGFAELAREIARASRGREPIAVAFIEVDHPEDIDGSVGDASHDATLLIVINALREQLRPYDLLFHYGATQFVCALPGLAIDEAAQRLAPIKTVIAASDERVTVSIGITDLRRADSPAILVARADAAMSSERRRAVLRQA